MNRRIPRLALFVVLLVSMLGIFAGGGGVPSFDRVMAQDSCGKTASTSDATPEAIDPNSATGQPGEDFDIVYSAVTTQDTNDPNSAPKSLTQLLLHFGTDFIAYSDDDTILHVDEGNLLLNVCGDPETSKVVVLHGKTGEFDTITSESAPDTPLEAGDIIFIDAQDAYYLTAVEQSGSTVQQLDYELSTEALPTAQSSGTTVTVASGARVQFCSRIRCVTW